MNEENKNEVASFNKMNYIVAVLVLVGVLGVGAFVIFTEPSKVQEAPVVNTEDKMMEENEGSPSPETEVNPDEMMRDLINESGADEVMMEGKTDDSMVTDKVVVNVTGENFKFLPSTISVKVGSTVVVNFESTSGFHDFVVDEFSASTAQVNTGGKTSVEFVADKIGSFEYYCSVGNHRAQGMVGMLTVTE